MNKFLISTLIISSYGYICLGMGIFIGIILQRVHSKKLKKGDQNK